MRKLRFRHVKKLRLEFVSVSLHSSWSSFFSHVPLFQDQAPFFGYYAFSVCSFNRHLENAYCVLETMLSFFLVCEKEPHENFRQFAFWSHLYRWRIESQSLIDLPKVIKGRARMEPWSLNPCVPSMMPECLTICSDAIKYFISILYYMNIISFINSVPFI